MYFQKNVHVNNINMIHYNRNDVFQGVDVNKTNGSKKCDICHSDNF